MAVRLLCSARMRLSIPAKVFAGFAAVLVAFGLVTAFGLYQWHRIGQSLALISQAYQPLTRIGAQLDSAYRNSEQATIRLLDETDLRTRRALLHLSLDYYPRIAREKVKAAQNVLGSAHAFASGPEETPFLDRLDGLLAAVLLRYGEYQSTGSEVLASLRRLDVAQAQKNPLAITAAEADFGNVVRRLKKIEDGIGNSVKDFASELDDRIDQRVRQTGREERQSALLFVVLSLVAVTIGVLVTVLAQRILAPIRGLTEGVKDVGEGRFSREIAVRSTDELGILAYEFNAMAKKLLERERQLQEKTAEVLRAERLAAVGRLAAQITHEIRNPLASLSLNTEMLEEQLLAGLASVEAREEARALVKAMAHEVDRLTEVTEEYLRFARMPKPMLTAVDLNDAMEDLVAFMSLELAADGVAVSRDLADEAPRVQADPAQLRQATLNLVRNAREAAGKGGHVTVRTRLDPGRGRGVIEVEDDGPGVPPEARARLFEPFFSTKERGTGLGLALVQQIVHEHGGEVDCREARPHGALFAITLPLLPAQTVEAKRVAV